MSCITALSKDIVPLTFGADGLPIADRSTLDALELEKARAHLPGLNSIEVPPQST
ncbi:MAG: hypothetical protein MUC50_21195 [Myxococcota bacterium]|jgi:hypothetical protein|nr:hypothetical protein [Myxococcota bacterium]